MTTLEPPPGPDDRFTPVFGQDAYETDTLGAESSRAAQSLAMSTEAFGTPSQVADIRDDAEALGVPYVEPAGEELAIWRDQERLDDLTRFALRDHGVSGPEGWYLGAPTRKEEEIALWRNVEFTHAPTALLALLNYTLGSEAEVERVAAAAGLRAFGGEGLVGASGVLTQSLESEDDHVAMMARAVLGEEGPTATGGPTSAAGGAAPPATGAEVSLAIHGTWAQVAKDSWYVPGSPLHSHLLDACTPNLYDEVTYFTWSGVFSQEARDAGASELRVWHDALALPPFDTVFTHSHGGNVALTASGNGEVVRMFVLMHTPVLPRSDDEWGRIRDHVGRAVVMRTRLDHVVLADGLVNGSTQRFDQAKLPHKPVELHWANPDAWFSHTFFTKLENWQKYDLAGAVIREHVYAAQLSSP
ncbi:hypothetical protein [Agromyces kandeliae]|uniref:Uncharacterized protein n=1 Tax=Agromyces kandeliae TaxID=2666141 RepID=A0A6L5R470_9MICO|nr:hypothetical protein [Agromyces kandeliae]MRX44782.1 hypothetical protein [Agromyces kandeliae]